MILDLNSSQICAIVLIRKSAMNNHHCRSDASSARAMGLHTDTWLQRHSTISIRVCGNMKQLSSSNQLSSRTTV